MTPTPPASTPPTPRDVACREFVERVTDYLEGVLAPDDLEAVEAHLRACDGCRAYLEQIRTTSAALGEVPTETVSQDAYAALMEAFRR